MQIGVHQGSEARRNHRSGTADSVRVRRDVRLARGGRLMASFTAEVIKRPAPTDYGVGIPE
jgi:hypothetical protein